MEVVQISQRIAERVAQLAVGLDQPADDGVGKAHVFGEVDRGGPQPQQLGPVFVDDLLDFLRPFRFRQRVPFAVERPAVGGRRPIRSLAAQCHRDQQGTVEPAAVLIPALEIHVGRPRQLVLGRQHRQMACAGVEPDVQDVTFLAESLAGAAGASRIRADEFRGIRRIPNVGGVQADQRHHAIENLAVRQRLLTRLAIEHDDGHAPGALPRDAPVRPRRDHVADALLAPRRIPLHLLDGLQRLLAEGRIVNDAIHADKPLFGRAEDGRMVAAPAVRIAVLDLALGDERARVLQNFDDDAVALPYRLAEQFFRQRARCARRLKELPRAIDGAIHRQPVLDADHVVFLPVSRGRVHRARALFECDMLAQHPH